MLTQLAIYVFFALSMGIVFFRLDASLEAGLQNRMGLFFFCCLQLVFVNISTLEVFIKDRVLFM
ncbi:unnamed protein product [Protopolystoma xenopodis]|uniref:ABC-2 type transporter domain-containing protein n=1 Tax=Protopolystoma xenopodis TaxID=117903 RepID=A0A3S5CL03_9PLAT|nr:unnamed protein product [Protopolystoma xenopodis]